MIGLNKGFLQCDAKKKCQTPAWDVEDLMPQIKNLWAYRYGQG